MVAPQATESTQHGDTEAPRSLPGTSRHPPNGSAAGGGSGGAGGLEMGRGGGSALGNGLVKSSVKREGTVEAGERPHNLRQPRTSSFPSGHASAAFLAATLLSERSKVKPLWFGLATIVATSRIHVRIHHASDVVLGAGIGLTLGRLVRRVVPLPRSEERRVG